MSRHISHRLPPDRCITRFDGDLAQRNINGHRSFRASAFAEDVSQNDTE
jgi:hypothetical protein